jgi:RHS repeat-associated protein
VELATSGVTSNAYRFAGEQFDNALEQYFLRARYLNVGTGMFLAKDEFEFEEVDGDPTMPYGYSHGDPVTYVDPSGFYELNIGTISSGLFKKFMNKAAVNVAAYTDVTTSKTLNDRAEILVGYFKASASANDLDANALASLGWSESEWITSTISHNSNGTTDYGIMQLNSASNGDRAIASPDRLNIEYGAQELSNAKTRALASIERGYTRMRGVKRSMANYDKNNPNNVYFLAVWYYKGLSQDGYNNALTWYKKFEVWPDLVGVPATVKDAWGNP